MPKTEPFYRGCSSANCENVAHQVMNAYDKKAHKKKPLEHMKGGLATTVLEPAHVPVIGELKEYVVSKHGLGIEFKRCYEYDYIDKHSHQQVADTCTKKRVVNIPQRTMNCYVDVAGLLRQMHKKGRPGINNQVLAMVACSKSGVAPTRVAEPMSPAIVAAAIGESQYKVRKTMEELIKTGKLATDQMLPVLNERQVRLPPRYQTAFDDFIRSEKVERRLAGLRMIFGKGFIPSTMTPLPEATTFVTPKGFAPKKLSKKAMTKFLREAEEWKMLTGIVPAGTRVKRPSKIKKAPKKTESRYELEQALALGGHI